jgi:DNA repair protein RecO (recombination protein O)
MPASTNVAALILKRWDSGEADRRIRILSRERGRMDVTAKGARKGGSRLAGISEPLTFVRFEIAEGKYGGFVKQGQIESSFSGLRSDYLRLSLALSLAEIVAWIVQPEHGVEEIFDATVLGLKTIEIHPNPITASVWTQLRLMQEEGISATWDCCIHDGSKLEYEKEWVSPMAGGVIKSGEIYEFRDRYLVDAKVLIGLARTAEMDLPPTQLRKEAEALQALLPFWENHIGRELPAGRAVLDLIQESLVSGE